MLNNLVQIKDVCYAVLEYIHSDEFKNGIDPSERHAVMSGLAMACLLMMGRCQTWHTEFDDINHKIDIFPDD